MGLPRADEIHERGPGPVQEGRGSCSYSTTFCTCKTVSSFGLGRPWCHLHQAVFHGLSGLPVDAVLAPRGEELALLNLVGPDTLSNTDHPEELVDVIARVAEKTSENYQHIVHLMLAHDGV